MMQWSLCRPPNVRPAKLVYDWHGFTVSFPAPLPLLTKKLENLTGNKAVWVDDPMCPQLLVSLVRLVVSEIFSDLPETPGFLSSPGFLAVAAACDPTLDCLLTTRKRALPPVHIPDWAFRFLSTINQHNSNLAEALPLAAKLNSRKKSKLADGVLVKDRPTELGLPRVGSTPDFRNLSQDRSTASTPTLGSPKSFRRNSSKAQTPVGHSPAVTPVPGSPRALRKTPKEKASAQKLPGKGDDVGVDAMVAVSVPEVPVSRYVLIWESRTSFHDLGAFPYCDIRFHFWTNISAKWSMLRAALWSSGKCGSQHLPLSVFR